MLIQMPHEFLAEGRARKPRIDAARARASTASAWSSCRAIRPMRRKIEERVRADRAAEGQTVSRLAHRADQQLHARRDREGVRAVHAPGVHRPRPGASTRRARVRAQALRHPQARLQRDPHLDASTARSTGTSASLSHKTLVYKGMLHDRCSSTSISRTCSNPLMESALALVHSRFSTNTFPSWDRAHPYRYIAHNGEINTLRGNINWMHARAGAVRVASCSATTSRRSCRSSIRTASTRRCSTTRSSCSCWPAARCRTR